MISVDQYVSKITC